MPEGAPTKALGLVFFESLSSRNHRSRSKEERIEWVVSMKLTTEETRALYYAAFVAANNGQSNFALTLWQLAERSETKSLNDNNRSACLRYHEGLFK
jgi:hypothetical protein